MQQDSWSHKAPFVAKPELTSSTGQTALLFRTESSLPTRDLRVLSSRSPVRRTQILQPGLYQRREGPIFDFSKQVFVPKLHLPMCFTYRVSFMLGTEPFLKPRPRYVGQIWEHSFISMVRPTIHTNPSRKPSFSKTLLELEEFENVGFELSVLKTALF